MNSLGIARVDQAKGQPIEGVELAFDWIFGNGLSSWLERLPVPYRVYDRPSTSDSTIIRWMQGVGKESAALLRKNLELDFKQATQSSSESARSIFIGGDHVVGISTVQASLQRHDDLGVIWVDAHADINTPETSPTGNYHGMVVSELLGYSKNYQMLAISDRRYLNPKRMAYVGVRDIDPGEKKILDDMGILVFSADCVRKFGIQNVFRKIRSQFESYGARKVHLSFDIDSVDPEFAPSTGVCVKSGLTPSNIREIANILIEFNNWVAIDIVEFNPKIGTSKEVLATGNLILSFLFAVTSGYSYQESWKWIQLTNPDHREQYRDPQLGWNTQRKKI
ncbi:MAG: arginase family protein [Bdellovibrionales bacterium]|nr:arginase family protein [Bdellovibrionales bacterium]